MTKTTRILTPIFLVLLAVDLLVAIEIFLISFVSFLTATQNTQLAWAGVLNALLENIDIFWAILAGVGLAQLIRTDTYLLKCAKNPAACISPSFYYLLSLTFGALIIVIPVVFIKFQGTFFFVPMLAVICLTIAITGFFISLVTAPLLCLLSLSLIARFKIAPSCV